MNELTVPSSEQEANLASVGLKVTLLTGSLWAWNILTLFMLLCQYLSTNQSLVGFVLTNQRLVRFVSTNQKRVFTWCIHCGPRSPSTHRCDSTALLALDCREPGTQGRESWGQETELFTCNIVSKLNVRPFQRVNSPELAPVINLLPSGVQERQNIGHLHI